jgi:CarboxypepD_reg-like domain
MRTRISIALLLLLAATAAFGTTIRGKVVAADGTTPYPEVEVTIESTKKIVYTDRDGEFYVQNVQPGQVRLRLKTSRSSTTHTVVALAQPVTDVKISTR